MSRATHDWARNVRRYQDVYQAPASRATDGRAVRLPPERGTPGLTGIYTWRRWHVTTASHAQGARASRRSARIRRFRRSSRCGSPRCSGSAAWSCPIDAARTDRSIVDRAGRRSYPAAAAAARRDRADARSRSPPRSIGALARAVVARQVAGASAPRSATPPRRRAASGADDRAADDAKRPISRPRRTRRRRARCRRRAAAAQRAGRRRALAMTEESAAAANSCSLVAAARTMPAPALPSRST